MSSRHPPADLPALLPLCDAPRAPQTEYPSGVFGPFDTGAVDAQAIPAECDQGMTYRQWSEARYGSLQTLNEARYEFKEKCNIESDFGSVKVIMI